MVFCDGNPIKHMEKVSGIFITTSFPKEKGLNSIINCQIEFKVYFKAKYSTYHPAAI